MEEALYYEKIISKRIIDEHEIFIYGAGMIAKEVAYCFVNPPYCCEIKAFLVSSTERNPKEIMNRPVISIDSLQGSQKSGIIVVAVSEKYMDEIKKGLKKLGSYCIFYCGFEGDLWSSLRGNYFRYKCIERYGKYLTLTDDVIKVSDTKKTITIYTAKCHLDKKLETERSFPWEKEIQVGTDLTDKRFGDIQDNKGQNISIKNQMYCELTALYWIWKNDKSDYAGLCHYRRHFELTEEILDDLCYSDIDVILTIPVLNYPSVRDVYEHDHIITDWDTMLNVVKDIEPEYYDTACVLENGDYYYAYNMLIAKKDIIDEYCEWLFGILEECEKRCGVHDDVYQSRFIGFLAERLQSIFFIHNWNRWKILHAEKTFLC